MTTMTSDWLRAAEDVHRDGAWFAILVVDLDDPAAIDAALPVMDGRFKTERGDALGQLAGGELVLLLGAMSDNGSRALARILRADLAAAGCHGWRGLSIEQELRPGAGADDVGAVPGRDVGARHRRRSDPGRPRGSGFRGGTGRRGTMGAMTQARPPRRLPT